MTPEQFYRLEEILKLEKPNWEIVKGGILGPSLSGIHNIPITDGYQLEFIDFDFDKMEPVKEIHVVF